MKKNSLTSLLIGSAALLALAAAKEACVIKQNDRTFSTNEITIHPGEKIVFKNEDEVTHNVFSVSKANPFTIKVQKPGESSTVDFNEEGVTEVRCAIHPKMKIIVTVKK